MAAFSDTESELQRLVSEASMNALTADERTEAAEYLDQLETEAKMMPSAAARRREWNARAAVPRRARCRDERPRGAWGGQEGGRDDRAAPPTARGCRRATW